MPDVRRKQSIVLLCCTLHNGHTHAHNTHRPLPLPLNAVKTDVQKKSKQTTVITYLFKQSFAYNMVSSFTCLSSWVHSYSIVTGQCCVQRKQAYRTTDLATEAFPDCQSVAEKCHERVGTREDLTIPILHFQPTSTSYIVFVSSEGHVNEEITTTRRIHWRTHWKPRESDEMAATPPSGLRNDVLLPDVAWPVELLDLVGWRGVQTSPKNTAFTSLTTKFFEHYVKHWRWLIRKQYLLIWWAGVIYTMRWYVAIVKYEAGRPPECSFFYGFMKLKYHKVSSSYKDMEFDYIFIIQVPGELTKNTKFAGKNLGLRNHLAGLTTSRGCRGRPRHAAPVGRFWGTLITPTWMSYCW